MPQSKDYYSILGVKKTVSEEEIKRAYRELVKKYHPDTHPGDKTAEENMKRLNEAYECLSDREKRTVYDRYGSMGLELEAAAERERQKRKAAPAKGSDIEISVEVDFYEACRGVKRAVRYSREEKCSLCGGAGYSGSGGVCARCIGSGRVKTDKNVNIAVPAGIADGQIMQIKGQGSCGRNGGEAGDLLVTVKVGTDPVFRRSGSDIYAEVPVSFAKAALGGEITVPALDRNISYTISSGTQNGTLYRLAGEGIKKINSSERGDLYITILVEIPQNLSLAQREQIKSMDKALKAGNYGRIREFEKRLAHREGSKG